MRPSAEATTPGTASRPSEALCQGHQHRERPTGAQAAAAGGRAARDAARAAARSCSRGAAERRSVRAPAKQNSTLSKASAEAELT